MKTLTLAEQVRIEESMKPEIDNGNMSEQFVHYLATHPKARVDFMEEDAYFRRMVHNFS